MKPRFTDVEGAKSFLCCGTTHLFALMRSQAIRRVKHGTKTLIVVESLERYAEKLMAEAA